MAKKYRKKPIVIEAKQLTPESMWEVWEWIGDSAEEWEWDHGTPDPYCERYIIIRTLEGNHKAQEGDYVIKGVKGEFYPCKPDIFQMTYEEVHG